VSVGAHRTIEAAAGHLAPAAREVLEEICTSMKRVAGVVATLATLDRMRDERVGWPGPVATLAMGGGGIDLPFATDQDLSAIAAIRSTERGVTQVGLMRVCRGPPHLTSPCDGAHFGYFATQPVRRRAASLAGSAGIAGRPTISYASGEEND
jgi:hypothetical protein